MHEELFLQRDYLEDKPIKTIYFGGGTPSLLSAADINALIQTIESLHEVVSGAEITLEANPDDLSLEKVESFKSTPINRFSLGVQSFFNSDLQFMNRSHDAELAKLSINRLLETGFSNLTIDLIYGTPTMSNQQWADNLAIAIDYGIPHLSCYCLTVEPQTALDHMVRSGKVQPVNDEKAKDQFEYLVTTTEKNGFEHYEISNFAKPGFYARHNSNYWNREWYLGIGPSAHSYNGNSRQWNVAHNNKYVQMIKEGKAWFNQEQLSATDQYNEYIMTSLRTKWGGRLDAIPVNYQPYFLKQIQPFISNGLLEFSKNTFSLTQEGKLLADNIAAQLFWVGK